MECTALGTPIRLSDEDVARSALLQHLKGTRGVFDLPFRVEHVRAWQAQKPDADDLFSIDDLEAGLKVRTTVTGNKCVSADLGVRRRWHIHVCEATCSEHLGSASAP